MLVLSPLIHTFAMTAHLAQDLMDIAKKSIQLDIRPTHQIFCLVVKGHVISLLVFFL